MLPGPAQIQLLFFFFLSALLSLTKTIFFLSLSHKYSKFNIYIKYIKSKAYKAYSTTLSAKPNLNKF